MGDQNASGLTLFDLLARAWTLQDAVVQVVFNHDDTAVLFRMASGAVALAGLKDDESPKIRTRMELETGRTTIRPRENPVAPVISPKVTLDEQFPVTRFGGQGFAGVDTQGALLQITAGGQVIRKEKPGDMPITSICSSPTGHLLSIARGTKLTVHTVPDMAVYAERDVDQSVTCQSMPRDETKLAAWGKNTLSLIDLKDTSDTCRIHCEGPVTDIVWNDASAHLACASSDMSFHIVDLASQHVQRVEGYPAPVRTVAFSEKGAALLTSGAYRLVGWSSADLPHDDLPGTALSTGKPGLVVIDAIAAHPKLDLVAAGYANGLTAISRVGTPEEMMLHQEANTSISALGWSKTGEHLAIGFASGKAAIATFPAQLFK
ncbi:WD40 repeat domain-containing protein [uncultured Roseobacter sp.]|uniref:WD40 repeat domain-containing protein n=1 Tax=uncultured Roseobacter sp. TaxID=114847 RepID=UPI002635E659|nr:WD40 repeat domain-containing protein [uncultured Roseobacter sp.]